MFDNTVSDPFKVQTQPSCLQLEVLKLTVSVTLLKHCSLPPFLGSTLHGGFGHALMAVDEKLYSDVFNPTDDHNKSYVKPFSFSAPVTTNSEHERGATLTFTLTLFGSRTYLVGDVIAALFMWQNLGVGVKRSPFQISSIQAHSPWGFSELVYNSTIGFCTETPSPYTIEELLQASQSSVYAAEQYSHLRIETHSRVRLKVNNEIVKQAPCAQDMASNICRRLFDLTALYATKKNTVKCAMPSCESIQLVHDNTHFDDMQRYSKKEARQQRIGGIEGEWIYCGYLVDLMPWLTVGQAIGFGAKTTFAFGNYSWQFLKQ